MIKTKEKHQQAVEFRMGIQLEGCDIINQLSQIKS